MLIASGQEDVPIVSSQALLACESRPSLRNSCFFWLLLLWETYLPSKGNELQSPAVHPLCGCGNSSFQGTKGDSLGRIVLAQGVERRSASLVFGAKCLPISRCWSNTDSGVGVEEGIWAVKSRVGKRGQAWLLLSALQDL